MKAKRKFRHFYGGNPYARRRMPNNDGKIFQNSAPFPNPKLRCQWIDPGDQSPPFRSRA
jgi:hypothetical protein